MKLTVFAGTFNPIHIAHLIVGEVVRDELKADKITYIPSFIPPHREENIASPLHRLKMVQLAVECNDNFLCSDIEYRLKGVSYTVNTIRKLYENYPEIEGKINFIIGADAFEKIDSWNNSEELAKMLNFIVIDRPGNDLASRLVDRVNLVDFDYQIIKVPAIEISSSYIRERIKLNKSIKYLVTNDVQDYILCNNLYNV